MDSNEQILFYNYFTLSQFLFHTGSRWLTIISPTHSTAFFPLPSDSACLPLPEPLQWPPRDHTLRSLSLSLLIQPQSQRKLSEPRIQSPLFPGEHPAGWPVTNRYGPHSSTRHSQPSPGNTEADFLPVQCPLEPLPGTPAAPSPRPSLLLCYSLPPSPLHITVAPPSPHSAGVVSTLPPCTGHDLCNRSASLLLHISSREQGLLRLGHCSAPQCLERCLVRQGAHSLLRGRRTTATAFSLGCWAALR